MIMPKIKYTERGRAYCANMPEIIKEATDKGLSKADIARIAEVDPSTVRNWGSPHNEGVGALKPARKLCSHLNSIGSIKSIEQSVLKEEQVMKIAHWLEEGILLIKDILSNCPSK
ncbi:MAG: transposase [Treponema sp.]|jgi:ribosome-binding protein aMBF1 (putative translation factor)|nr:transposase [Treponema sp.]